MFGQHNDIVGTDGAEDGLVSPGEQANSAMRRIGENDFHASKRAANAAHVPSNFLRP